MDKDVSEGKGTLSPDALREKALKASVRFLERRGLSVIDRNWECADGEVDLVAVDDDGLRFVFVVVSQGAGGFESAVPDRGRAEALACAWLAAHADMEPMPVTFDELALHVVGPDRAFLSHHVNCLKTL